MAVTPRANPYTQTYSLKAVEMIAEAFLAMDAAGLPARHLQSEKLLTASTYAGIAFGNAGVGAVHGLSYPVSGKYHVAHGEANYLLFVAVFRAYAERESMGALKTLTAFIAGVLQVEEELAWQELDNLMGRLIPRKPLSAYGVTAEDVAGFADTVLTQQQRLLNNSYVKFDKETVERIYKSV